MRKLHAESVRILFSRMKNDERGLIDTELKKEIENQVSFRKNVLHQIVETVSFLASRGLAFRGDKKIGYWYKIQWKLPRVFRTSGLI